MGPPGVGKGTEAELLVEHYNIPHISTGQIFRETIKEGSKLGMELKECLEKGLLVSDEITNQVVANRLEKDDVKNGFLFDGYPRTIDQAKALEQLLSKKGIELDAVVTIKAPIDLIVGRLGGRRSCEICGRTYHIVNKKPKVDGVCDFDGGKLIIRKDDTKETLLKRIGIYDEQT